MIVSVPGMTRGRTCNALTESVDIYPTMAELAGLPVPEHCEGLSMVPLLDEPGRPWKKAAISQYPRGPKMGYSVRTATHRYTEWVDKRSGQVKERSLYDHTGTPVAKENLVRKGEFEALVKRLSKLRAAGWKACLPESR
jgi:arylsulfatase A-like enzyme